MLRVLADDADAALSLDNLAFFADRFYGRSNFHKFFHSFRKKSAYHYIIAIAGKQAQFTVFWTFLFVTPDDPAFRQIIGGQFQSNLVAGQDADVIHTQLAADVGQDYMLVFQLHLEHGVGQLFHYPAFNFNHIGF